MICLQVHGRDHGIELAIPMQVLTCPSFMTLHSGYGPTVEVAEFPRPCIHMCVLIMFVKYGKRFKCWHPVSSTLHLSSTCCWWQSKGTFLLGSPGWHWSSPYCGYKINTLENAITHADTLFKCRTKLDSKLSSVKW